MQLIWFLKAVYEEKRLLASSHFIFGSITFVFNTKSFLLLICFRFVFTLD